VTRSRRRASPGDEEPVGHGRALEVAARYLGARPRTRWEVERRLRRAGADEPLIADTIERLGELGYLDDAAFAAWWADQRDRHAPRGRRMVEAELRQRGIGREVIEALREAPSQPARAAEDGALPRTEAERAVAALTGHLRGRPLPSDPRALKRIGMFLVRRGFDPETARHAIRALAPPDATDELS
jgi:regulatory protein